MALDLTKDVGMPLDRQRFSWREMGSQPFSKLNDDAYTRVRVILMNGIEADALRFGHLFARMNRQFREPLARVRRAEQHQQSVINWLTPPDQSILETTIGYEQVAVEVTASIAQNEPDPYLAQCYRFGLLEDFDHLYRYSALMDRVEGRDPNNLLQSYTDILPGRPTSAEHRAPEDDLRTPYDRNTCAPVTRLNALTVLAGEYQTHDYYMVVGPQYADPIGRQLYAEIASIEEQHVTQYESMIDPDEGWMEKWLLHEAMEVYNYWSCVQFEDNRRIKSIWERFLDYELGHLHFVRELFKLHERRDPAEVLPQSLPDPIRYQSQRQFVRSVLAQEVDLRARGSRFIPKDQEPRNAPSSIYRETLNSEGSPSDTIAGGYRWMPGTELVQLASHAA